MKIYVYGNQKKTIDGIFSYHFEAQQQHQPDMPATPILLHFRIEKIRILTLTQQCNTRKKTFKRYEVTLKTSV